MADDLPKFRMHFYIAGQQGDKPERLTSIKAWRDIEAADKAAAAELFHTTMGGERSLRSYTIILEEIEVLKP